MTRARASLIAVSVTLGVLAADAAWAQIIVRFEPGGRVSVVANNAPLQDVLAAWARSGGTVITNVDRVGSGRVTVALEDVTEAEALKVILQGQPGYMATFRERAADGASVYARVMILGIDAARRRPAPAQVAEEATSPATAPLGRRGPRFGPDEAAPAANTSTPPTGSRRPGVIAPPPPGPVPREPAFPDAPEPEPRQ